LHHRRGVYALINTYTNDLLFFGSSSWKNGAPKRRLVVSGECVCITDGACLRERRAHAYVNKSIRQEEEAPLCMREIVIMWFHVYSKVRVGVSGIACAIDLERIYSLPVGWTRRRSLLANTRIDVHTIRMVRSVESTGGVSQNLSPG